MEGYIQELLLCFCFDYNTRSKVVGSSPWNQKKTYVFDLQIQILLSER